MSAFSDLTFTTDNIVCLAVTVAVLFLIPLAFGLIWRKRHKEQLKIKYLLAGAVCFILFARVLELGVHYLCIIMDNPVSRFINESDIAYVLYGIVLAGVFEECGRYIILKYFMKKDRSSENAVLFGIGHAGIEIWTVIVPSISMYLVIALIIYSGNFDTLSLLNITEETAKAYLPLATAASEFGGFMLAMNVMERMLTMFVHVGLTIIVFFGVTKNKKSFLPLAIILHMIVDLFAALYQRSIVSLWLSEVWVAMWTAIIICIALKLYRKMKPQFSNNDVL